MPLNPNDPHDLRLVITDVAVNSPNKGEFFAVQNNNASGIAIPAFRTGTALPIAGSIVGEGFFITTSKRGYVWNGGSWDDVTPSPIKSYPTDADLLAAGDLPGTYANTEDTGNLYMRMANNTWLQVNVRHYADQAAMEADTTPVNGTQAELLSDGSLWIYRTGNWICSTLREFADIAAIQTWTTSTKTGDQAVALDHDIRYIRTGTGWKPLTIWEETETNILAATWALAGQEALATDTGSTFIFQGGVWKEDPIQHFATQTALLAATPPDGTLAWADDTSNVFTRAGGNWKGLNTGFADPIPVGTISAFPTATVPAGWLKCDGSAIPASSDYDELRAMFPSGNLPDLQGEFLRGTQTGKNPLDHADGSTARPNTPFTSDITGVHDHQAAAQQKIVGWTSGSPFHVLSNDTNDPEGSNVGVARTDRQGGHQHRIDGGGDAETAPDHTYVVWCIKAKYATIIPTAMNMTFSINSPANGDVLTYDLAHQEWNNKPAFNPTFAPPIGDGDILIYNAAAGIWYNTPNRTIPHAIANPAEGEILSYDAANSAWANRPAPAIPAIMSMTQAAYDALGTKDPNTLYLITGP